MALKRTSSPKGNDRSPESQQVRKQWRKSWDAIFPVHISINLFYIIPSPPPRWCTCMIFSYIWKQWHCRGSRGFWYFKNLLPNSLFVAFKTCIDYIFFFRTWPSNNLVWFSNQNTCFLICEKKKYMALKITSSPKGIDRSPESQQVRNQWGKSWDAIFPSTLSYKYIGVYLNI